MSAFQKKVRGEETVLRDHISKEMNPLNLERCRCIPKNQPGADWRVLQQIADEDPARAKFQVGMPTKPTHSGFAAVRCSLEKLACGAVLWSESAGGVSADKPPLALLQGQDLVPWCLPNTAERHNGWRGLFGRLDWAGHFPTSTTDPQPMGKVGQVFHPVQDRIVSVRECARAQVRDRRLGCASGCGRFESMRGGSPIPRTRARRAFRTVSASTATCTASTARSETPCRLRSPSASESACARRSRRRQPLVRLRSWPLRWVASRLTVAVQRSSGVSRT